MDEGGRGEKSRIHGEEGGQTLGYLYVEGECRGLRGYGGDGALPVREAAKPGGVSSEFAIT